MPVKLLNPHPVAEATAVERDKAMVVERGEEMVDGMAGIEAEEFILITPVRRIAPTPSHI